MDMDTTLGWRLVELLIMCSEIKIMLDLCWNKTMPPRMLMGKKLDYIEIDGSLSLNFQIQLY